MAEQHSRASKSYFVKKIRHSDSSKMFTNVDFSPRYLTKT